MKLYDAGAILLLSVIGVFFAGYSTLRETPAPQVACKMWVTEAAEGGKTISKCIDGEV